jgi:hypothetical protein
MLYIGETGRCLRTRFGEHRRAVIGNDANQPVARHFNNGNHSVSDMIIRALCPGAKLAPFNSGGVCQNCPAKTDDALQRIFISGHKPVKFTVKQIFPYKFLLKYG